jgi:hypothetical protein
MGKFQMTITFCSKLGIEHVRKRWKDIEQWNLIIHPENLFGHSIFQEIRRNDFDILLNQNGSYFHKIVEIFSLTKFR